MRAMPIDDRASSAGSTQPPAWCRSPASCPVDWSATLSSSAAPAHPEGLNGTVAELLRKALA
jgi:hypothetical protein